MVKLRFQQIRVLPGQRIQLENISWNDFEVILEELGEHRGTRIAYSDGTLEIMAPSPKHETAKVMIGEFVKILLDEQDIPWECLGSTTFKETLGAVGIEPDNCFYIQNCSRMIGKNRLDLTIDPPPDLAIEIDLTSKTQISAYAALKVPEVWCYDNGKLTINVLRDGKYINADESLTFPGLPLIHIVPQFIKRGQTEAMSAIQKSFRQWMQAQLA